jgi:hypothetical protein
MIEEGIMLADNDPAILLRSLAIKIQDFELSMLNEINVKHVLNDIEWLVKEAKEKMYEKFQRKQRQLYIFKESRIFGRVL